jgi:hypothetical protein
MADDKRSFFRRPKKDAENPNLAIETAFVADPLPVEEALPMDDEPDSPALPEIPEFVPEPEPEVETQESPIEQKVHEILNSQPAPEIAGWENNMLVAPTDGSRIMVSETGMGQGQLVYWRISKFVDKAKLRYVARGRWTDFLSKLDITYVPKYWKEYNPEEYWPLNKVGA